MSSTSGAAFTWTGLISETAMLIQRPSAITHKRSLVVLSIMAGGYHAATCSGGTPAGRAARQELSFTVHDDEITRPSFAVRDGETRPGRSMRVITSHREPRSRVRGGRAWRRADGATSGCLARVRNVSW